MQLINTIIHMFLSLVIFNLLQNMYIYSSQLSNYNQENLRTGDSTVVKKVPVTAPHAGIVFDSELNPLDYLDVSNRSFKQLYFGISNSLGNEINLNGVNVSCHYYL